MSPILCNIDLPLSCLLPDAVRFLQVVKRAAVDAVRAMKPVEICFGQVTGISPLKILVEQKLPLEEMPFPPT